MATHTINNRYGLKGELSFLSDKGQICHQQASVKLDQLQRKVIPLNNCTDRSLQPLIQNSHALQRNVDQGMLNF